MRRRSVVLGATALSVIATVFLQPASGQDGRFFGHKRDDAPTLAQVARMIDHIEACILNQGTIGIKQPDIWSQNRMTMFRKEFEDTMRGELGNFEATLAARIARSDTASLQSQTALGAVLTPFGTPTGGTPFTPQITSQDQLNASAATVMGSIVDDKGVIKTPTTLDPSSPAAASFSLLKTSIGEKDSDKLGPSKLGFGLEPNINIDEKADYITHLHRLRRVNLGDDNTDSAGYGLYLMRIPVSIQPGDHTVKGHGAVVTVTMRHDFAPKFLYTTYRNLVINDAIDKISTHVYELIRSGRASELQQLYTELPKAYKSLKLAINDYNKSQQDEPEDQRFLLPNLASIGGTINDSSLRQIAGEIERLLQIIENKSHEADEKSRLAAAELRKKERERLAQLRQLETQPKAQQDAKLIELVRNEALTLNSLASSLDDTQSGELPRTTHHRLAANTLDSMLDRIPQHGPMALAPEYNSARNAYLAHMKATQLYSQIEARAGISLQNIRLLSSNLLQQLGGFLVIGSGSTLSRSGTRVNAIAPSDVARVFIPENILKVANSTQEALGMKGLRAPDTAKVTLSDVRAYLRHELESAYDIVAFPRSQDQPLLMDIQYIESIVDIVANRNFEQPGFDDSNDNKEDNDLEPMYGAFVQRLPGNLKNKPLGPLCWAIAIEAGLLNRFLRDDIIQTKGNNDYAPPPNLETMFFYQPQPDEDTERAFEEYVKARWPMITFALEPVVDQQNIEDAFTRRRDLQLAVAFALASGRISFRQAMTYNRQLQYEAQTIALNQTVSSFAYGNDTFGWRFTPRYQTPPEESNPRAIANLLLRGGPGPNYQIKNSKIEPGMRELTAVVVMPSFVKGMRIDASSDWFKLADPDDRKISTAKTVELGRKINEAKQCLEAACTCGLYRPEDVERLRVRLHQLESMLPMQTSFIKVPFENTVGGFALFTQGASALVPELSGYEGIEYLDTKEPADIIVYGKHFSIYESAVVVGGMALPREGQHAYRVKVDDATKKQSIVGVTLTPFRDKDGNLVYIDQNGTVQDLGDNGSYDILSREVLRVRIPAGVKTAFREDGQEIVELYVASPNGISNRLQIPVLQEKKEQPPRFSTPSGAGMAFIDSGMRVQVEAYVATSGSTQTVTPTGVRSVSPDARVRIQPIGPNPEKYEAVNLLLNFSVPTVGAGNSATIPIQVTSVGLNKDSGFYEISAAQLNQIAGEIYQRVVTDNKLTLPPTIVTASAFATPVPNEEKDVPPTAQLTNAFTITVETVLVSAPTAANALNLAPQDQAIARAGFAPQASPAGSVPLQEPQLPAEVLRTGFEGQRTPTRNAAYQQVPGLPQGDNGSTAQALNNAASALAASAAAQANASANNLSNQARNALPALPGQSSQSLVVVPQSTPRINVNVPVTNTSKHKLFHRDDRPGPANAPRRSILNRIMNGP